MNHFHNFQFLSQPLFDNEKENKKNDINELTEYLKKNKTMPIDWIK